MEIPNALFRLPGLVLLFWTHPIIAAITLLIMCTTNGTSYRGWALIKNSTFRCTFEVIAAFVAAVGYWRFPHYHPVLGQILAAATVLCMLWSIIELFKAWNECRKIRVY